MNIRHISVVEFTHSNGVQIFLEVLKKTFKKNCVIAIISIMILIVFGISLLYLGFNNEVVFGIILLSLFITHFFKICLTVIFLPILINIIVSYQKETKKSLNWVIFYLKILQNCNPTMSIFNISSLNSN